MIRRTARTTEKGFCAGAEWLLRRPATSARPSPTAICERATTAGVEHYTRTWSDALVTGIEYFSEKLAPGLKLDDFKSSLNGVVVASNHSAS